MDVSNQTIFEKYFYFSQQTNNLLLLTISAFICGSVSILAYYAIFFITVARLSTYKHYLINITTWNTILWMNATIFLRKDYPNFVPNTIVVRGVIQGFGGYIAHVSKTIEEIALAQIGIAIATCALFKFVHLTFRLVWHSKRVRKFSIFGTLAIHLVSAFSIGTLSMLTYCPVEFVNSWLLTSFPDFEYIIQNKTVIASLEICQPQTVPAFNLLRILHNFFAFGATLILLLLTTIFLWKQRTSLSLTTLKMMQLQIVTLFLHALIPIIGLLLPYVLKPLAFLFIIKIDADTRIYINLISIWSTAANNLTTILVITPYRKKIFGLFMRCFKKAVKVIGIYKENTTAIQPVQANMYTTSSYRVAQ